VTDVSESPRLPSFVRLLWDLVTRKTERDLVKMGQVRPELMRVVYSRLTDAEAAARIGSFVESNPRAARTTLRHVRDALKFSRGYDTDRACRILDAAIQGRPPAPVRAQDVQLFDRERELGWLPLGEAFARLRSAVPELAEIQARAEELAATPDAFGIVYDEHENVIDVPSGVLPTAHGLVGPGSRHPDPLIRSNLAATVAARYVAALLSHTTDRAVWQPGRTRLRITGSISFRRG
jgi:hypothetical protein